MLKAFYEGSRIMDGDKLFRTAPLIRQARKLLGERTVNSILHRCQNFVATREESKSGGYTLFGIPFGDHGRMPAEDFDYCWENSQKAFPQDDDDVKRFLGTVLMVAFCLDSEYWVFVMDPDKKLKKANGEVPAATKYFMCRKAYNLMDIPLVSNKVALKAALQAKFMGI